MGGYVTMVVAIFIIVFTAMTLQSQEKLTPLIGWRSSAPPVVDTVTGDFTATIQACKNIDEDNAKTRNFHPVYIEWNSGSTKDEAVIEEDREVPYIEKRVNVPVVNSFFEPDGKYKHSQSDDTIDIDGKKYEVFYPMKSGELLSLEGSYKSKSRCDPRQDDEDRYCEERHRIYFIDYQLVFLRHLNPDGTPVVVPGTETARYPYHVMDVYQSTESIQDNEVGMLPDEAFDCSKIGQTAPATSSAPTARPVTQQQVYLPRQETSTSSSQLQLEWFIFGQSAAEEAPIPQPVPQLSFEIGCKPAVYLYPKQKQLVNVKVFPKGLLTYTDPVYDLKNGWTVEAHPDGTIYDSRFTTYTKPFPYLYYESKIHGSFVQKPTQGWVIQSGSANQAASESDWFDPMEAKFNQLLPQLGLNTQQTADFIDYWKKALPYSPYYFIGIVDPQNVDTFEPLEITPKPDSINRVRIYFERLDEPKTVQAPILPDQPIHQLTNLLFHVTEWGGMVKNDPDHPFTCSQ